MDIATKNQKELNLQAPMIYVPDSPCANKHGWASLDCEVMRRAGKYTGVLGYDIIHIDGDQNNCHLSNLILGEPFDERDLPVCYAVCERDKSEEYIKGLMDAPATETHIEKFKPDAGYYLKKALAKISRLKAKIQRLESENAELKKPAEIAKTITSEITDYKGNIKNLVYTNPHGYKFVYKPDSTMANKQGWSPLHREVMAASIGRPLKPEEVVHHIDRNPGNNKLSNLMLFANNAEHRKFHGQLRKDKAKELIEELIKQ